MAEELNEYDALLQQDQAQATTALRSSALQAQQYEPEQYARSKQLAAATGIPAPIVAKNLPEIEKRAELNEYDALLASSPALASKLADPEFAAVARKDTASLQDIERNAASALVKLSEGLRRVGELTPYTARTFASKLLYGFGAGAYGYAEGAWKTAAQPFEGTRKYTPGGRTPLDYMADFYEARRIGAQNAMNKTAGAAPTDMGATEQAIVSGVGSSGEMMPALALAWGTRSLAPLKAAFPMLFSAGVSAGGQAVTKGLEAGAPPAKALMYGLEDTAAEIAGEFLPALKLMKDLKVGAPFVKILFNQAIREIPSEMATTAAQSFNEQANLHPDKSVADYVASLPAAEYQTIVATLTTTLLTAGMGKALTTVSGVEQHQQAQAEQAEAHSQAVGEILKGAQASNLLAIDASSFQSFMQALTPDGHPLADVWLSPTTLQESGVDIEALAKLSPSFAGQVAEGLASKGEVLIPTAELATVLPGSGFEQVLLPHIRATPDAMTQAEAQSYAQNKVGTQQAEMAKALEEGGEAAKHAESAATVEREILAQLNTANRFTPDVNSFKAKYLSAIFATEAQRTGKTAEQVWLDHDLLITSEGIEGAQHAQRAPLTAPEQYREIARTIKEVQAGKTDPATLAHESSAASIASMLAKELGLTKERTADIVMAALAHDVGKSLIPLDVLLAQRKLTPEEYAQIKLHPEAGARMLKDAGIPENIAEIVLHHHRGYAVVGYPAAQEGEYLTFASQILHIADVVSAVGQPDPGHPYVEGAGLSKAIEILKASPEKFNPEIVAAFEKMASEGRLPRAFQDGIIAPGETTAEPLKGTEYSQSVTRVTAGGLTFPVVENPTRESAANLAERATDGRLRGYRDDAGNLIVWDASKAIHIDVMTQLGEHGTPTRFEWSADEIRNAPQQIFSGEVNSYYQATSWYRSALNETVAGIATKQASAQGWKDQIKGMVAKGTVKQVELDAVGLNDWLDLQQGRVTKEQVQAFLGENGVRVEEVVLSDRPTPTDHLYETKATKFHSYQLPGGENYKELLLTLPARTPEFELRSIAQMKEFLAQNKALAEILDGLSDVEKFARINKDRAKNGREHTFQSAHYEQKNILAHVRFNERTDADGQRVLFLEEIQSDWAQKGRKEGFADNQAKTEGEKEVEAAYRARYGDNWRRFLPSGTTLNKIPSAPFVGKTEAWTALALKRMIRYAAENGFDRVAWTTGEQQAERYDLSKQISNIAYSGSNLKAFDHDGAEVISQTGVRPEDLVDYIGKEAAEKLMAQKPQGTLRVLEGQDLKVGGEGMKGYYDKIVPSVANDVLKKLGGGKVGEVDIPNPFRPSGSGNTLAESKANLDAAVAKWGPTIAQPGFDITPELAARAAGGLPLFQAGNRGSIRFPVEGIGRGRTTLTLTANANLSTFFHEVGHFAAEMLFDMARAPEASPQIKADAQKLLNWIGVTDLSAWDALPSDQKTLGHEQIARGHEAYGMEGKAPSPELTSVFARLMSWMKAVYGSIKGLNDSHKAQTGADLIPLSDEVRGVWDRMLATDAEIEAKAAEAYVSSMFDTPEAGGMTTAEWQAYRAQMQDQTDQAISILQTRAIGDMRWLTGAQGRILKAMQKDASAKRAAIEAEVTAEVRSEPIYAALRFLHTGEMRDEEGGLATVEKFKLDTETILTDYPELKGVLNDTLRGITGPEGLAPDFVAEQFGLSSGDELIRKLVHGEAPPEAEVIQARTDQRTLERYGDLTTPEAIQRAAGAALANEAHTRFISTEMNALTRALGDKRVLASAAKAAASGVIAQKQIRYVRPGQYAVADRKSGREADKAFKAGDIASAAEAKRNQLVNAYATRAANDALGEVDKGLRYLRELSTKTSISGDYRQQIAQLLDRFNLKPMTEKEMARAKGLAEWAAEQEAQGLQPVVDPRLLAEAQRKPFKEMTVEEFRGLIDTVKNIEHLGRLKQKLLTARDDRTFAEHEAAVVLSIESNAARTLPTEIEHNDIVSRAVSGVKEYLAWHRRFANKIMQLDGWKDAQAAWATLVRPANDAAASEAARTADATKALIGAFRPMLAQDSFVENRKRGWFPRKDFIPEINTSLSREGRLMIALYSGEEGNLQRLRDGDNWTDAQIKAVTDTLTPEDWAFCRKVWAHNESFRDEIGAQQLRLTGLEPDWLAPRTIDTPHGPVVGGYVPAKYDSKRSTRSLLLEAGESIAQQWRGARGNLSTAKPFTKARAKKVLNRPLRKDFGVITQHTAEVIHRLSWQDYLTDAQRLLRDGGPLDASIRAHYGPELLKSLRDDLADASAGDIGAQSIAEAGVNHVRNGATVVGLGWRLTTAMMQFTGFTQTAVRIGPKWLGVGIKEFLGDAVHMENSVKAIYAKSPFMVSRGQTMQRELSEILSTVSGDSQGFKASFFYLIQKAQLMVDVPTWLGAYHKSLALTPDERLAREQADQAVKDAQGSGQLIDLAGVQRGSPYQKLLTNFMSYFITRGGLTSMVVGRTKLADPVSVGKMMVDMMLLYSIPAALVTIMQQALKGALDDDDDDLAARLAADQISYLMGGLFGIREFTSAAQAALDLPSFDYRGPTGVRAAQAASQLGKKIKQGDWDMAAAKAANEFAGIMFHYPAGQLNASAAGFDALLSGDTDNPGALIVGPGPKQ